MKIDEYETMFRVEDRHWWYVGLRGMMTECWRRHMTAEHPRILDAGCGTGANLAAAAHRGEPVGIDLAPLAVQCCRERGLTRTAAASTVALPFPSGQFDMVLSMDVIQHEAIADKEAPLREIHRVLKPRGLVLVNLPAYQWLHSSHDVAVQQDRRFTKRELEGMLEANGFELAEMTYWNTLLFVPAAAVRLWRKRRPPEGSDLVNEPGRVANAVFGALLALERRLIQTVPLPFGLSIFAAARKI